MKKLASLGWIVLGTAVRYKDEPRSICSRTQYHFQILNASLGIYLMSKLEESILNLDTN